MDSPCPAGPASGRRASATECLELKTLKLAHVKITDVELVAAGTLAPPAGVNHSAATLARFEELPSFCRVAGAAHPTADSDIRFEVWLPRFELERQARGRGQRRMGRLHPLCLADRSASKGAMPRPRRIPATARDSMDARFATGQPRSSSISVTAPCTRRPSSAKAVIDAFYGKKPRRALFSSCLHQAGVRRSWKRYRYPEDYDAISSMAPANPMVALMVSSLWTGSATTRKIPRTQTVTRRIRACTSGGTRPPATRVMA